jgi:hypothetical protein
MSGVHIIHAAMLTSPPISSTVLVLGVWGESYTSSEKRCTENPSSAAGDTALRVVAEAAEWVYWSWLLTPPMASNILIPLGELDYATPNRSGNHNLRLNFGAHHRLGGT